MRARATPFTWREDALTLAMGLAVLGFGAGLAHSAARTVADPPAVAAQPAPQQATMPDFICHAPPGVWCDLRDWRGFGTTPFHETLR